jgi:tRNA(adenine34) deaminase
MVLEEIMMLKQNEFAQTDIEYMQQALEEAQKAAVLGEVPVGAVIVKDGAVIGRGYNLREQLRNSLAHAELIAIDEASRKLNNWRLEGATLYVTLEPCPMCAGAIVQSRIKRLVYGATDAKGGSAGTIVNLVEEERFNHQVDEIVAGVLAEESATMLSNFFQDIRTKSSYKKA